MQYFMKLIPLIIHGNLHCVSYISSVKNRDRFVFAAAADNVHMTK